MLGMKMNVEKRLPKAIVTGSTSGISGAVYTTVTASMALLKGSTQNYQTATETYW